LDLATEYQANHFNVDIQMTDKKEYYRTLIGAWDCQSGDDSSEEYRKEQVVKLIGAYPSDKEIILEVVKEVWE
jgi:hypothetical protein